MIIEVALETAIKYEIKIRDLYKEAAARSATAAGKRIFSLLAAEEQGHADYLEHRLAEWLEQHQLTAADLTTALPHAERRAAQAERIGDLLAPEQARHELALLQQALAAEQETSAFYAEAVAELPPEGRAFFARFVEIENGHVDFVLWEIDSLTNSGFWMGVQEFDMELMG
jgi:rubrerythrin